MADTGWIGPASNYESASGWTNPDNGRVEDGSSASANGTCSIKYYNFSIPSLTGKTIDGIEVRLKGYKSGSVAKLKAELMYSGRATAAIGYKLISLTNSNVWATVGSSIDNWGRLSPAWDPADFTNANFAVRVEDFTIIIATAYVDSVEVKVYYSNGSYEALDIDGEDPADIDEIDGVTLETGINEVDGV